LWGFEEAKAALGLGLSFVAVEHLRHGPPPLIQLVGGQEETTVLVDERLTG